MWQVHGKIFSQRDVKMHYIKKLGNTINKYILRTNMEILTKINKKC